MPASPTAKLLIVDDEPSLLKALEVTLRDEGYAVTGVTSGEAALATLAQENFDLVMTDLVMPKVDGVALLSQALAADPNLAGIVMTGHGSIPSAVAAMKAGAIDYVLKPITLNVMLPVLERALLIRQLRIKNARLEKKVRQRTLELEMANEELEAFCSSVSHDLRTPLRALSGFVEILVSERDEPLPPNARRLSGFIQRSATEMDELITSLLELSRLGLHALTRQPVNLDELCREAYEGLADARAGRQIELRQQTLPTVDCDRALMKSVFLNLLSNAIKYSRPRNPAVIEVGVKALPGESSPVYFVRDNGVGFDQAHTENLFGVFQRLHQARDFEGAGVGLATVRRVIERHGGTIWAEGAVDVGATLYFTLPVQEPESE